MNMPLVQSSPALGDTGAFERCAPMMGLAGNRGKCCTCIYVNAVQTGYSTEKTGNADRISLFPELLALFLSTAVRSLVG